MGLSLHPLNDRNDCVGTLASVDSADNHLAVCRLARAHRVFQPFPILELVQGPHIVSRYKHLLLAPALKVVRVNDIHAREAHRPFGDGELDGRFLIPGARVIEIGSPQPLQA